MQTLKITFCVSIFIAVCACSYKKEEIPSSFSLHFSTENEDSYFFSDNQGVMKQEEIGINDIITVVDDEIEYPIDSEQSVSDSDSTIDDAGDEMPTKKCEIPTPNVCADICCPNNYECRCEEQGGFCLPFGAEMCSCTDKTWCEPLQKCIDNEKCHTLGMICKPLGAKDCPHAEDCYCGPESICTNLLPVCCPLDTPVPCGDYCCPLNNICIPDLKDCISSGWDYCPQWQIKCPPGKDCMEKQSGCKGDGETECDDGAICAVNNLCVGQGNGENNSGCCPGSNPIACDSYCCPSGTHCDAGCEGCVVDGYKCCDDGQTSCLNDEICWKGGASCLASGSQDCGDYWCNPSYVCSSGSQKCCAVSTPQTCGKKCCHAYETCYDSGGDGYCVDEQGGEEYCGNSFKCGPGENCCGYSHCYPEEGACCEKYNVGSSCGVGYECCIFGCKPVGTKSDYGCNFYCDIGLKPCGDGCIPDNSNFHCCKGNDGCGNTGVVGLYCPNEYHCRWGECLPKDKVKEQGSCCKIELIPGKNEWKCADIPGTIPAIPALTPKPLKPFLYQ